MTGALAALTQTAPKSRPSPQPARALTPKKAKAPKKGGGHLVLVTADGERTDGVSVDDLIEVLKDKR